MSREPFAVRLESPLPESLPAGTSTALYCVGTATFDGGPVRKLELLVDGEPHRLDAVRMPRADAPCLRVGFWGVIPVRASHEPGVIRLHARAQGRDGRSAELSLGAISVLEPAPPREPSSLSGNGLIAVCMATFNPDRELLRAQLDSLRSQTDPNWTCVISDDGSSADHYEELRRQVGDDPRFVISRSPVWNGFYRNFERALSLAPPEAELIALCDQDDIWHPDKLAVLRSAIGSAALAYSDLRLVDPDGRVLRETLWSGRSNNSTSMASMLIANTVTGASMLLRREVAERALPFPESPGVKFHDHWIALVALACGELAYVDRPLHDYVQHPKAILGKVAGSGKGGSRPKTSKPRMQVWRATYFLGWLPGEVAGTTLLLRCEDRLDPHKRRAIKRYISSGHGLAGFAWLMLRPMRGLTAHNETLWAEWELAPGLVWRAMAGLAARWSRWPRRWMLDTTFPPFPLDFDHRRLRRWRSGFSQQPQ